MGINNSKDSSILDSSLTQVQQLLGTWAYGTISDGLILNTIFGDEYDRTFLNSILQAWQNQDFSIIF